MQRIIAVIIFILWFASGLPAGAQKMGMDYALPPSIRARLPKGAIVTAVMERGKNLLYWYGTRSSSQGFLEVWRADTKNWTFVRRTKLPEGAMLVGAGAALNTDDWLEPSKKRGPLFELKDGYCSTFYVFPQGFEKAVVVWSGGSGDAGFNCSFYKLGPPDKRGFRILKGRYQFETVDTVVTSDIAEWERYWTGDGWGKKSPDRIRQEKSELVDSIRDTASDESPSQGETAQEQMTGWEKMLIAAVVIVFILLGVRNGRAFIFRYTQR